jgi:ankyrin repeat protein
LAQLHLDSLRGKTSVKDVRQALVKLPSGSDAYYHAYQTAMERIKSQFPEHQNLATRVLAWITCAKRPLNINELRYALAVEVGTTYLNIDALPETDIMVQVCVGLVTIDERDGIIRLVHYTTQEYFEKTQETWFPKAENDITTTCATYLNFTIFKSRLCASYDDLTERLWMNPLYHYASQNWGYHACNAATICQGVIDFLESDSSVESSSQALLGVKQMHRDRDVTGRFRGLHLVAYFGAEAETRFLLDANNPDLQDHHGRTAMFYAAIKGHSAVLKLLLDSGADVDLRDSYGMTPLSYMACCGGQEDIMQLLLESGAKADSTDDGGQTPLSHASEKGHKDLVRLLLRQDVEVDSKDLQGLTPLSHATTEGNTMVVQILITNGAKVDSRDGRGHTPLGNAAKWRHTTVAQLLLEYNAKVDSENADGQTPLSYAAGRGALPIVQLLLEYGAKVNSRCNIGRTPLAYAALRGDINIVQLLLENSAEVDLEDYYKRTPLSLAAEKERTAVIELLLENGAKVDAEDEDKRTPLSFAAEKGHTLAVQILLEYGAKVNSQDKRLRTPLDYAVHRGYDEVHEILHNNLNPSRCSKASVVSPSKIPRYRHSYKTYPLPMIDQSQAGSKSKTAALR